jgi:type I restriction enzyme, S subunit
MPKVSSKWKTWNASDLIRHRVLDIGDGYRAKNSEMGATGLPFARAGNINGGFLFDDADILCQQSVSRVGEKVAKSGDIVFTSKGTVGRFAFVKDETPRFVYSPQLCYWRVLDRSALDARFLFYWMQSPAFLNQVHQVKGLTDMADYVSLADQRRMTISAPDIDAQESIAKVIGAYDDLIENNTRRIKILEEMAQMIYREWFVNFRYPGHEKVKLMDSELGPIPNGWKVTTIDDVAEEIIDYRGKTPHKLGGEWAETGIVALSALNVKQGRLENLDKAKLVSEDLYHRWMKSELKAGDILMTSEVPLGQVYFLPENRRYCLSQRLFSIRADREFIKPVLLYFALSSKEGQKQIHARASGTTVLGIRQSELRHVPIVQPESGIQEIADTKLQPFLNHIDVIQRKNVNLRHTRDLLLSKLISGEIDVEHLKIETVTQNS